MHFDQIPSAHKLSIFVGPLSDQILQILILHDCLDKMCPSREKVISSKNWQYSWYTETLQMGM